MARPATLTAALLQLEQLSTRLTLASHLFKQHTGKDLAPLLDSHPSLQSHAPASPQHHPPPPSAPPSAPTPEAADPAPEAETEPEPFDISPLVLKALAIRKAVHQGELDDGEKAVEGLVGGLPISDAQRAQLRTWAGLE